MGVIVDPPEGLTLGRGLNTEKRNRKSKFKQNIRKIILTIVFDFK